MGGEKASLCWFSVLRLWFLPAIACFVALGERAVSHRAATHFVAGARTIALITGRGCGEYSSVGRLGARTGVV